MKTRTRRYAYVMLTAAMTVAASCQSSINGAEGPQVSNETEGVPVESSTSGISQDGEPTGLTEESDSTDVAVGENIVFGKDASAPSQNWSKPELRRSYLDPSYGTHVTRVTSAEGDRFNRNTYSRRQAENAVLHLPWECSVSRLRGGFKRTCRRC